MSEPIRISTSKYHRDGIVDVDGMQWKAKLIGTGTDMKLRQAQRRLELIDKKIKNGTATESDLDKYDEYEKVQYDVFVSMFDDGTEDNRSVKKWVDETPYAILLAAFDDLRNQTMDTIGDISNGQQDQESQSS